MKNAIILHGTGNTPEGNWFRWLEDAKYLAEKLDGRLVIEPGQGHFNLETGTQYRRFPLLLRLIESQA
jgi:predicted alpha/beta hydrolase family esterase